VSKRSRRARRESERGRRWKGPKEGRNEDALVSAGPALLPMEEVAAPMPAQGEVNYVTYGKQRVKAWVKGVLFEPAAQQQVFELARMPWVFKHVAVMPDVHAGKGSTVGTVFATKDVVVPSAVGSDIGCGMLAERLDIDAAVLKPEMLPALRAEIERRIPVGGPGLDVGSWPKGGVPKKVEKMWENKFAKGYEALCREEKEIRHPAPERQIGSLGSGNHALEIERDENGKVWLLLHSGSRGAGHRIGMVYTRIAQRACKGKALPNPDLAYLVRGDGLCEAYERAMRWAQAYAWENRLLMLAAMEDALRAFDIGFKSEETVHCHHNYISRETVFGQELLVVRKGATSARVGQMGLVPGSMSTHSFVVRGLGNEESFYSCSHGAGRAMSRGKARRAITLEEHRESMKGIEGRLDVGVLDESSRAYKDVDAVMAAQSDLVEPVHTLKQLLVVKG